MTNKGVMQRSRTINIREKKMKTGIRLDKGQIEVVDSLMAEVLRSKTPAERIRIGFGLWTSARKMLFSHLSTSNPEWDAQRLNSEAARRLSHGSV
jgi:hypothetical protein